MNTNPINFSIAVCLWVIVLSLYATLLITSNDSTFAEYLSGFSTLGAALIASFLYTDWRKPILVSKIGIEIEKIKTTRRSFKQNLVDLQQFLNSVQKSPSTLSDDNSYDKYKKIINLILDDMEDLNDLLISYKCNFNSNKPDDLSQLKLIEDTTQILSELHSIFTTPDFDSDYVNSFKHVNSKKRSGDLKKLCTHIVFKLHDELSTYYSKLIK